MTRRKTDRPPFPGFDRPESNFFRMPNSWTDITADINNIAELKVVEYILRHTWGYQEYGVKKHITIDEFVNGRRRQDGSRMDKGTGLSERAVYDGLRKAVENGLIDEETDDSDRGRIKKSYSVRMRENGQRDNDLQTLQAGVQSLHPPLQAAHPGPQMLQPRGARNAPRTEKDTQEKQENLSKFERSRDMLEEQTGEGTARPSARSAGATRGAVASEALGRVRPSGPPAAPASLRDLVARRRRITRGSHRGSVPEQHGETHEARERLRAFLADFAVELGDEAPLASTITRTLNIFTAGGIAPEQWGDLMYQARGLTQEHSAQIRKRASGDSSIRHKNKMPYFLATLEQLVGLRPTAVNRRHIPEEQKP